MKEIISSVEIDLGKCKDALNTNNLMEIAIAIEEMIDKHKSNIDNIASLEKGNVWSYNKRDLEYIVEYLGNYKMNVINKYKKHIINESFKNAIENIENNTKISNKKKDELIDNITDIMDIVDERITIEENWEKLRKYISIISNESYDVGYEILELIFNILKNSKEI